MNMVNGFDIDTLEGAEDYLRSEGVDVDQCVKDGMEIIERTKALVLSNVSGSFEHKCSVKVVKTSEHCPEKPTKKINGDYVCDRCYENWKHLQSNDR